MQKKNDVLMDFLSTFGQPDGAPDAPAVVTRATDCGVMCDAAADIPVQFVANQDINILPTQVKLGGEVVLDKQSAYEHIKAQELSEAELMKAEVKALDSNALGNKLSSRFALQFDSVIAVCSHHSLIDSAGQMRSFILKSKDEMRAMRKTRGMKPVMDVTIHDSKSVFCGTGLQAIAIRDFVKQGLPYVNLRRTAERLAESTHVFLVPGDTKAFGKVLRRVGDLHSEEWIRACTGLTAFSPVLGCAGGDFSAAGKNLNSKKSFAMVFKELTDRVFQGLSFPSLLIAYGGDVAVLSQWPEFGALEQACAEMDVNLLVTPSGLSSRALSTPGSLCAAFVANNADSSAFVSTLAAPE
jgi:fatty acid-binding protein DegV